MSHCRHLKIISLLIACLIIFPALAISGQFKVVSVYDGDTFKAVGHDIEIKVRLAGIDTPETSKRKLQSGQPYSIKAKEFLAGLVLYKPVDIKGYGLDRYGRILGVVFVDGKNVNLELVKAGLAEVYQGKPPKGFDMEPYLLAEIEVKKAGRGMWSLRDKYVSPKEWRKSHRK